MNAIELSNQTGKSISAIKGKFKRMGFTEFGQRKELPDSIVNHYVGSQSTDDSSEPTQYIEPVQNTTKPKPVTSVTAEPIKANIVEPPVVIEVDEVEPTKPVIEKTELNDIHNNSEPFDLGHWLFFHPTARFIYVSILISIQAYVFSSLAEREFPGKFGEVTKILFFVGGFVIGTAGVMIAKNFTRIFGSTVDTSLVNAWLAVFFLFDIAIDYSYIFTSWSDLTFGGVMVGLALPLGILAHSANYTKSN